MSASFLLYSTPSQFIPDLRTNTLRNKSEYERVLVDVSSLIWRAIVVAGSIEIACSLFVHPFGTVRILGTQRKEVLQGTAIPPGVNGMLSNSCMDCHSDSTRRPWYGYVAPVSWMLERDVANARKAMNLSKWEEMTAEEKIDLLTKMRAEARSGLMPPRQYKLVHSHAKPSAVQLQEFIDWTRTERDRLRSRRNESNVME